MSFRLSWIAVKGPGKDAVLATLGLVEAPEDEEKNEAEDFPPAFDHSLAELPSGWIVVLTKDFTYPAPKRMAAVSAGGTAIACSIEEHVMYSAARLYQDGQAVWSIDHDGGSKGIYHLDIAGSPPPELAEVRERLMAQQDAAGGVDAEADYIFELPGDLCEVLSGYKFDPEREDGPRFTRLERVKGKGGGLLSKLFGRK